MASSLGRPTKSSREQPSEALSPALPHLVKERRGKFTARDCKNSLSKNSAALLTG